MFEKLRASWQSYREKRRQYRIERALYKAERRGYRDATHGGFEKEGDPRKEVHGDPFGGGPGGP